MFLTLLLFSARHTFWYLDEGPKGIGAGSGEATMKQAGPLRASYMDSGRNERARIVFHVKFELRAKISRFGKASRPVAPSARLSSRLSDLPFRGTLEVGNVHRRPSNGNARRFGQLAGVLG